MKVKKTELTNGLKALSQTVSKIIDVLVINVTDKGSWAKTYDGVNSTWHYFENLVGDCEICVNFNQFSKIINICEDEVKLSVKDKGVGKDLIIKSGRKSNKISMIDNSIGVVELPSVDFVDISNDMFKAISRVIVCASNDNTRPILEGVNISNGEVLATDARRLAIETVSGIDGISCTIPSSEVLKVISEFKDTQNMFYSDDNCIYVRNKNTIRKVMLIDGDYPNAKRIIPNIEEMKRIDINSSDFSKAIKDLITVCGNDCRLDLNFTDNVIKLNSAKDGLSHDDEIECVFDGEFEISINPVFVKSAFDSFVGSVRFYFTDNVSPIVIGDDECKFIMMPIRR